MTERNIDVAAGQSGNVITIIIPARNRAGLLKRTLDSVKGQTYRPLNVVLVDNDSTDKTLAVMNSWRDSVAGDINVEVVSEKRHGATWARNTGAGIARTPYLMFFDSDDEMSPSHVADFVAAINSNPDVQIIGRDVMLRQLNSKIKRLTFDTCDAFFNHIFHASLSTQRYVVSRNLYNQAGGWDTKAWGWDDYELGVRLLLLNPTLVKINGESVTVHAQTDSITGSDFSSSPMKWEDTLDLCERDLIENGRPDLTIWINVRRMILAADYRREGSITIARKLRHKTLAKSRGRIRLQLLYAQHRIFGHATALFARLLFPIAPRS